MTKKLKFTLITLLLAILSCLSLATVFAKYVTTQPIGDGYFDLSITGSKKIYAVYGEAFDNDDNSLGIALNFYNRLMPETGETTITYDNGKQTVGTVYYDFLNVPEQPQWSEHATKIVEGELVDDTRDIKSVTVVDEGIQPTLTKYWFADFERCKSFELSKLDTSKVTEMGYMFQNCKAVEHLDLSSFDTSGLKDTGTDEACMFGMFKGCVNLKTLDISNFSTEKVLGIDEMFNDCENLTTIYAGADLFQGGLFWNDDTAFEGCVSLEGGSGSTLSDTSEYSEAARIDGLTGRKGLLTCIVHPKIDATLPGVTWNFSTVSDKTNFAPDTQSYIQLSGTVPSEVMITSSDASVQSQTLAVDSYGVLTIPAEFMKKYRSFTISEAIKIIIVTNPAELEAHNGTNHEYTIMGGTYETTISVVGGNVNIDGGASITANTPIMINGGQVTIKSGTFIEEGNDNVTLNVGGSGTLIIEGGTFRGLSLMSGASGEVVIKGGTFLGFELLNGNGMMGFVINKVGKVTIMGGTFNLDPSEYVPEDGYQVVTNADDTYTVISES